MRDIQKDRASSEGVAYAPFRELGDRGVLEGAFAGLYPPAGRQAAASARDEPAVPHALKAVRTPHLREAMIVIRQLHDALGHATEQMRSMRATYEAAAEAMAASYERMQAVNEQLRSTAEALAASKDELQARNEALRVLNDELASKLVEINGANSSLRDLMDAAEIGTIVLDRHLRIARYSPQVEALCGIAADDVGRPLEQLTLRLGGDGAYDDAACVLREGTTIDREVRHTASQRWFRARFRPCHGAAGTTEGVVITFIDITRAMKYAAQREALIGTLEELVTARAGQIEQLTSELILSEQAERQRIAQVLHDDLQQLLIAHQMRLEALRHSLSGEHAARLVEADALVVRALKVTRTLTLELSPPMLKGENLTETLDWLLLQMAHLHDLRVEVEASGPVHVPAYVHILVYQLLRELLFNVVKHAGVDRARVRIAREEDRLVLVVEDEGAGFDPAALQEQRPAAQGGFGLNSVKERLALLGGSLDVDAAPGRGTRMTLLVPLKRAPAGAESARAAL